LWSQEGRIREAEKRWGSRGVGVGWGLARPGRRKGREAPRSRGKEETVNCVGGGGGRRGRAGLFWVFGKKATLKGGGGGGGGAEGALMECNET